jgi:hypothetical protein
MEGCKVKKKKFFGAASAAAYCCKTVRQRVAGYPPDRPPHKTPVIGLLEVKFAT